MMNEKRDNLTSLTIQSSTSGFSRQYKNVAIYQASHVDKLTVKLSFTDVVFYKTTLFKQYKNILVGKARRLNECHGMSGGQEEG